MREIKSYIRILVPLFTVLVILASCKSVKLSDAEHAERNGEYFKAANIYYTLYRKLPRDKKEQRGYMAFHAAENFRLQGNSYKSLSSYRNAVRYNYPDSISYLRIAQCYQYMGKYKEALKYYKVFLEKHPQDAMAKVGIEGTEMALREKAETESSDEEEHNPYQTYTVRRSQLLNGTRGDFSATYSPDGSIIYFTSSRSKDPSVDPSEITGLKPNDIYFVKRDSKGKYSKADSVTGGINTPYDEGTPAYSGDGKTIYYTYAEENDLYSRTAKIYSTRSGESGLSKGTEVMLFPDSLHLCGHPAPSPDGKWLYFVSDGPGSLGGKDIYRSPIKDGLCGTPEHLSSEINTAGDEMFPYMYTDSIMYFSSDGRPGYGGLDIYKAELDSLGHWNVSHLPVPLNSSADDFGFVIDPSKRSPDDPIAISGLLSSNRRDAMGRPHLYEFSRPAIKTDIEGVVYNRLGEPINKAWVRIVGSNGPVGQGMVFTRNDGSYKIAVDGSTEYVMLAGADTYLNQYVRFKTDSAKRSETYYIDFYLASRINPEKLDNIHYDFDKATLRPESKTSLDELIKILNDNPEVSINLTAHADRKGPVKYNQKLSERRARSVIDYLTKHGIDDSRLFASGEGKLVPHVVNAKEAKAYDFLQKGDTLTEPFILKLDSKQQAIADQLNRRTEFKVLDQKEVDSMLKAKAKAKEDEKKAEESVIDSTSLPIPDAKLKQEEKDKEEAIEKMELPKGEGFPSKNEPVVNDVIDNSKILNETDNNNKKTENSEEKANFGPQEKKPLPIHGNKETSQSTLEKDEKKDQTNVPASQKGNSKVRDKRSSKKAGNSGTEDKPKRSVRNINGK